uniref:Ribosome maturation factor RimM n=1 Tax=uncultured Armatimonadetes bacterium TaxID=157466 RepID=A0A6J4JP84_9BACT|nr:16S rRNA processing protein RimM [uncultured Armatimonadetes bacterium]
MTTAEQQQGSGGRDPAEETVLVGEIAAPHGVRGELRMNPLMDDPRALAALPAVRLRFADGREEKRRVTAVRLHKRQALLTIAGVADMAAAETLRGAGVHIRRDQLPALPADTYYEADLVGLRVVTQSGSDLGAIERVHFYPQANDVYETPLAMIPGVADEIVIAVDVPGGRMTVRDIPGLRKDE